MNEELDKKPNRTHPDYSWLVLIGGAAAGLVLALLLTKQSFCLIAYHPETAPLFPGLAAFGTILGIVIGIFRKKWFEGNAILKRIKYFLWAISSLLLAYALTSLISPIPIQFDKNHCFADFDKITALVQQEGAAVINKDMDTIHKIYSPQAVVTRVNANETWPAYTYYSQKFATEEHCTNSHTDFQVISYSSSEATMTDGSQGTYGLAGQGCTGAYFNRPGSDRWTFQKNNGIWKIVSLEFNIP